MDLVAFLVARVEADEGLTRARTLHDLGDALRTQGMSTAAGWLAAQGDRVLAECDSKRRIIELHQPEAGQHPDFCGHDLRQMPCPTLRLLALPYSSHPDYQESWRA